MPLTHIDNRAELRITNTLIDTMCETDTVATFLSATVTTLVDNGVARWGACTPHWKNPLTVHQMTSVYVRNSGWQSGYEGLSSACRSIQKVLAPGQEQGVSLLEDNRLLVFRLADKFDPENWLIFELEPDANLSPAIFSRWHRMIQLRLNDLRQHAAFTQCQNRIEEMSRGLAETMAQLVQAEKMSELGKLTAGIAHEINNPIGYIRSNLESMTAYTTTFRFLFDQVRELAAQHPECAVKMQTLFNEHDCEFLLEDCEEIVDTNLKGIDRISGIISDLYAFSRRADGNFKPMELKSVIQRCLNLTRSRFDETHHIELKIQTEDTQLEGDPTQLEQVIVNLMVNASHAMPGGGELTIQVDDEASAQRDWLVITLTDTGKGMETATLKRVFTPFFTTKPKGQGTGLGLSISQGIIHSHGGTIEVISEAGKGTTFTIRLPRAHEASAVSSD
ncbi:sensor histidine kinase [Salinimonas lutimaris]|uniref:sensor histidine kinase n=1 Tax=Salinimonas lutimaris TaxID=914153 RepID=UPI0010C02CA6|nr:ATP-binding protein [Salinimonas lutimaris]